jgi:hypothetical protein
LYCGAIYPASAGQTHRFSHGQHFCCLKLYQNKKIKLFGLASSKRSPMASEITSSQ